jgi:hypothetical protein
MPTQLLTHGQWWSIFTMHRVHMLQWCARTGLNALQRLQNFLYLFRVVLAAAVPAPAAAAAVAAGSAAS